MKKEIEEKLKGHWYHYDIEEDDIRRILDKEDEDIYRDKYIDDAFNEFVEAEFTQEEYDSLSQEENDEINEAISEHIIYHYPNMCIEIELLSNYDCINSTYCESPYSYGTNYFSDMIDFLSLNPKKVVSLFRKYGLNDKYKKSFKHIPEREGNELVDYDDFCNELANSVTPVNLWTFVGELDCESVIDYADKGDGFVIAKGTKCGLFSSYHGGGSVMGCSLLKNIVFDSTHVFGENNDYSKCLRVRKDNEYRYEDVYGEIELGKGVKDIYMVVRKVKSLQNTF